MFSTFPPFFLLNFPLYDTLFLVTLGAEGDPGKEGGGDGPEDHREGQGGVQGPGGGPRQEGVHKTC